jgi:uncharacterized protein (DUF302 family)
MDWHNSKVVNYSFDESVTKVTGELNKEGFGILTEIDVKDTLKKKLDVDFRKYKILGACNPPFAFKALQIEENLGVLLPCNVVVQEKSDNKVYISFINPMESMKYVANPLLEEIANEVSEKLKKVLKSI